MLLHPPDLARLRRMGFSPRGRTVGAYAGRHASAQRGHGVEFSDYREYTPGDPPGDVDWKAYARSDRMYIRLFEHQSDLAVTLVVDGSGSMGYGSRDGGTEGRRDEGARGRDGGKKGRRDEGKRGDPHGRAALFVSSDLPLSLRPSVPSSLLFFVPPSLRPSIPPSLPLPSSSTPPAWPRRLRFW